MDYTDFIDSKSQFGENSGFNPVWMPPFLFDFQKSLVEWACRKGRAAILADCGLGKTPMQLTWAQNVFAKTGKPVLILTPLAVAGQTVAEGQKFGIACQRSGDGKWEQPIVVTNYERLHYFNPDDFGGCVCDESSILKSFDGARRTEITVFMRKMQYRLLATATAAPNDYTELGTSSEALGYLGHTDMLGRFFRNDLNNIGQGRQWGSQSKWRFKGHAELAFWQWVCSWARSVRRPSDIGFDDGQFILPELIEKEHMVGVNTLGEGMLFAMPAIGLKEQRDERKRTIPERCEKAASLVIGTGEPGMVWCHLNEEGKLLSKLIPDSVEVSGNDSDDAKEEKLTSFAQGKVRVLITKPKIGALGLNLQHCNHMTFFPSHSYEQYYQGVRRCWRFGQKRPVTVDIVTTEGEQGILKNLQRKAGQADKMFTNLVAQMNNAAGIKTVQNSITQQNPSWITASLPKSKTKRKSSPKTTPCITGIASK